MIQCPMWCYPIHFKHVLHTHMHECIHRHTHMCIFPCAIELWVTFIFSFVFLHFQNFYPQHTSHSRQATNFPLEMQGRISQGAPSFTFFSTVGSAGTYLTSGCVSTNLISFSCSLDWSFSIFFLLERK